jgi:hypothetical protein
MEIITRKEAIEKGLKRFFNGKPCKRGHITERYVLNSGCAECKYLRSKREREENSEKYNKYCREYYQKNKDRFKKLKKRWELENKERVKKYKREWYQENKDKQRLRRKKNIKKVIANLGDYYIKTLLERDSKIRRKDIPAWLIELKRANIKLKRKLQEGGTNGKTKNP